MKKLIKNSNYWLSEKYANLFRYEPFVQTILLHKIYPRRNDVVPGNGTTSEGIDLAQFEYFIRYFTKRKVKFIDETDIIKGRLNPDGRYIYLTFDDGYYNNYYALDILKKYNAKATFYISTNHIEENKSFWWDVQFRERSIQGKDPNFIKQEVSELRKLSWKEQEEYITKNFGEGTLFSKNDLDRPMTREELKVFASNDSVYLGNHTHNHLNMTVYSDSELKESINIAEKYLVEIQQKPVNSIAYPYGLYNDSVINIMTELNYKIGITVNSGKNTIKEALDKNYQLKLNRCQLNGFFDIKTQLHNINSEFSIIGKIKSLVK